MAARRWGPRPALTLLLLLLLLLLLSPSAAQARASSTSDSSDRSETGAWTRSEGRGYSFSLGADGAADSGAIAFAPGRVDFGRVDSCTQLSFFVSIENRGQARVKLQRADFSRAQLALATDIAGIHLDPGGRFLVELRYLPEEPTDHYGAYFRVFTTAGVFVLPIHSQVVLNAAGVRAWRSVEPLGAVARHEIVMKNPEPTIIRVTEVFTLENNLYVEFPRGQSGLEPRKPQDHREPLAAGQHNGYWELEPGVSKTLVALAFRSLEPGDFLSYVHINTDREPYLTVPTRIKVLRDDAVVIDPAVIDLGVLTTGRHSHREKLHVYNTHAAAIFIDGVHVRSLSAGKAPQVTVHMLEEPFILQARSQDQITLEFNFPEERAGTSNNTSTPLLQGGFDLGLTVDVSVITDSQSALPRSDSSLSFDVRVAGKVLDGWIEYRQRETQFALTLPFTSVLRNESFEDGNANKNESSSICLSVSQANEATMSSVAVEVGSHILHEIEFTNQFNSALEIQRVYIDNGKSGYEDVTTNRQASSSPNEEVEIVDFSRSHVALPGESWPAIQLNVSPSLALDTFSIRNDEQSLAARTHLLVVATNATIHKIPLHFFHGILRIQATRGLSRYGASEVPRALDGVNSGKKNAKENEHVRSKKSKHGINEERVDGTRDQMLTTCSSTSSSSQHNDTTPERNLLNSTGCLGAPRVRICRSLLLDLGKVAQSDEIQASETFSITNDNPIPISLRLIRNNQTPLLNASMHATLKEFDESDETLRALSKHQVRWRQNSSFVLENQRHLKAAITEDQENASVSSTQFVLPPGHSVELRLEMVFSDTLGKLSAHLMTLQTPYEDIHIHSTLEVVSGAVKPAYPEIVLSPMFAGQSTVFDVYFQNTFNHDVQIVNVSMPIGMEVIAIDGTIPANAQAVKTLSLHLALTEIEQCRNRLNRLDCLIPTVNDPVNGDFVLSGFGGPVTRMDVGALRRRDEFWSELERQGNDNTVFIQAVVKIQTDLSRDPVSTDIIVPLLRSRLVLSAFAPDFEDPPMHAHGDRPLQIVFPHAQTRHLIRMFVNATNPSTSTINAELACHEDNQALFFACGNGTVGTDDSECLVKWKNLLLDASACQGDNGHTCRTTETTNTDPNSHAPLFYLPHRKFEIPAGKHALIGPIYYLPMDVHQVSLSMFVRNELSHIEQLDVVASSGSAVLVIGVLPPPEGSGISIASGGGNSIPRKLDQYADLYAETNQGYGTIDFMIEGTYPTSNSQVNEEHQPRTQDFSRHVDMHVENAGDFPLTISKVWLDVPGRKSGDSAEDDKITGTPAFQLESLPDQVPIARMPDMDATKPVVGENGAILILNPGDATHFVVTYKPSCYTLSDDMVLFIESTEGLRLIRFTGRITTRAAFACAEERAILPIRLLKKSWVITLLAGVACVCCIMLEMLKSSLMSTMRPAFATESEPNASDLSDVESVPATKAVATTELEVVESATEVERLLDEIDAFSFKPVLPISLPAVATVLERRQRGLFDPAVILKSLVGGDTMAVPNDAEVDSDTSSEPEESISDCTSEQVEGDTPNSIQAAGATEHAQTKETPDKSRLSGQTEGDHESPISAEVEDLNEAKNAAPVVKPTSIEDVTTELATQSDTKQKLKGGDVVSVSSKPYDHAILRGEEPSSDKVKHDLGWSLWDSKSLWPSSAENNPLEGNRDQVEDRELPSTLLPLSSLGVLSASSSTESLGRDLPLSMQDHLRFSSAALPPVMSAPALPTRGRAVSATKAPPGFTPADATPLEARAAFEKLRPGIFSSMADTSSSVSGDLVAPDFTLPRPASNSKSAGPASLLASLESSSQPFIPFGPILPDTTTASSSLGGIGSKRLASYREIWADLSADEQTGASKPRGSDAH